MNHRQEWLESAAGVRTAENVAAAADEPVTGPAEDPLAEKRRSASSAIAAAAASADRDERLAAAATRGALSSHHAGRLCAVFPLCRAAIKGAARPCRRPGHRRCSGAVECRYRLPGNSNGNWIQYFTDILAGWAPSAATACAAHLHPRQRPALITDHLDDEMAFQAYYYNFVTYRNFMTAIPGRHAPTSSTLPRPTRMCPWLDANNGWVQAAYAEINWWNQQPNNQQIRSLILYRWPRLDQWYIEGKNGVIAGFAGDATTTTAGRSRRPSPPPTRWATSCARSTSSTSAAPGGQIPGPVGGGHAGPVRNAQYAMVVAPLGRAHHAQRPGDRRLDRPVHARRHPPAGADRHFGTLRPAS